MGPLGPLGYSGPSSTSHCLSVRKCETVSLTPGAPKWCPPQPAVHAGAVIALIANLDRPSPSRGRIPRLGTDLQNRAIISWRREDRTCPRSTLAPAGIHRWPRSAHASWPCWPRTAGFCRPILRRALRKLRLCLPVTARVVRCGSSRVSKKLLLRGHGDMRGHGKAGAGGHGAARTPVVHDSRIYNRRVSWSRSFESSALPLFTILAHLTCFLPCFFRLGLFLVCLVFQYHDGPISQQPSKYRQRTALTTYDHDHQPAEIRTRRKRRREQGGYHTNPHLISSHLTSHTHTSKMFGRSRKASVSQSTTKSKPPSTAATRDSGVSKRRPSTASVSRRRPSCSAQNLVDPSGKWVSPLMRLNCHAYVYTHMTWHGMT